MPEDAFQEINTVLYCSSCRRSYSKGSLCKPCPNCGSTKWTCVFGGYQVINAFEDQEALRLLIDNCHAAEVKAVERIMGFNGGGWCITRENNTRIKELREHFGV